MLLNSTHNAKYIVIDPSLGIQKFTSSEVLLVDYSCFLYHALNQKFFPKEMP